MSAAVVDTRTVGKCRNFDGTSKAWQEWTFVFQNWLLLLDWGPTDIEHLMNAAAVHPTPLDQATLGPSAAHISRQLYALLGVLVQGRAHTLLRRIERGNGLEAWAVLVAEYEKRYSR